MVLICVELRLRHGFLDFLLKSPLELYLKELGSYQSSVAFFDVRFRVSDAFVTPCESAVADGTDVRLLFCVTARMRAEMIFSGEFP